MTWVIDTGRVTYAVDVIDRPAGTADALRQRHDTEFCFYFVLSGAVTVQLDEQSCTLGADDSIAIPGGMAYGFAGTSADLTLLEVTLPAAFAVA